MRTWIVLALLLVPYEVSGADVEKIAIVEAGIYSAKTIGTDRPSSLGSVHRVEAVRILERSTLVPAQKGIRFGFRYKVVGSPIGTRVGLRFVINFPVPGLRPPLAREPHLSAEFTATKTIGDTAYREFHFDEDWEIVPGLWTFEVWHGHRKIGEQHFCVVPVAPEQSSSRDHAEDCIRALMG